MKKEKKEEVKSYANGEFSTFLEYHINYFKRLTYKLETMLTVYSEIKEEPQMDYGWIPTSDFVKHLNQAKTELDIVFFEIVGILQHQKGILAGKEIWGEVQKRKEEVKTDLVEKKKEEVTSIYR